MKDISLGSQSLKKLKATTRHICVRFVSRRSTYGFGRTSTWSCKAMGGFFLIKISQTHKQIKQGFFHKPYLTSQQLNNYGFPKIWFTSSGLAKNKRYANQSLRSTEPEDTLSLILVIKQLLPFKPIGWGEWGLKCANHRIEERTEPLLVSQTWGSTAQY